MLVFYSVFKFSKMDNLLCLEPAQKKTCYSNSGEKNVNRISIHNQAAHVQLPGQSQTNNKDSLHWSKAFSVYNVLSYMWPCLVNRWPLWWTGKVFFLTVIFILFGTVVHVIPSNECNIQFTEKKQDQHYVQPLWWNTPEPWGPFLILPPSFSTPALP